MLLLLLLLLLWATPKCSEAVERARSIAPIVCGAPWAATCETSPRTLIAQIGSRSPRAAPSRYMRSDFISTGHMLAQKNESKLEADGV
jgi:hypothetical protein